MEKVVLAHFIHQEQDAISIFNLLDNFRIGFTLATTFFVSFLGIVTSSFLINKATHQIRRRRKRAGVFKGIVRALSSFGTKKLSAIGLFVMFVHLFIWIVELFLTNNIKVKV